MIDTSKLIQLYADYLNREDAYQAFRDAINATTITNCSKTYLQRSIKRCISSECWSHVGWYIGRLYKLLDSKGT